MSEVREALDTHTRDTNKLTQSYKVKAKARCTYMYLYTYLYMYMYMYNISSNRLYGLHGVHDVCKSIEVWMRHVVKPECSPGPKVPPSWVQRVKVSSLPLGTLR